jgi:hypothetical protein
MVAAIVEFLAILGSAMTELLYWLRGVLAGWRYLFSRSYRTRTHARWQHRSPVYAVVEVICSALACIALLLLLYFLIRMMVARS